MTQQSAADRIGVTVRAYQEWEAGGGIQWSNIERLAEAFEVDVEEIVGRAPSEQQTGTPDLLGATQLDRIEAKLDALIAGQPTRAALVAEVGAELQAILARQSDTRAPRTA